MGTNVSSSARDIREGYLAGTFLAVFLRVFQPAAQDAERLLFDFGEREAAAEIGLDIDDFGFGVEEVFAGENFDEHQGVLREGIHHIEIAAMQAELTDASGDAHVGFLLDKFGAGDESVAWRAALFFPQEGSLRDDVATKWLGDEQEVAERLRQTKRYQSEQVPYGRDPVGLRRNPESRSREAAGGGIGPKQCPEK